MADEHAPTYCTLKPAPGDYLGACNHCGHAAVLHIGTEHCPVCDFVDFNARSRSLVDSGRVEISVEGRPLDRKLLMKIIDRQVTRNGNRYLR